MEKIKVTIIKSAKKTLEAMEGIFMQRGEFSVSCAMWLKNQSKFKGKIIPQSRSRICKTEHQLLKGCVQSGEQFTVYSILLSGLLRV